MRVSNEGDGPDAGPLTDVLRLQSEFQLKIAEETMRYLRAMQGALSPVVPTSVLTTSPDAGLRAAGTPGERVVLDVEVENAQSVHVTATAALTPLVDARGTTWFPTAEPTPALLIVAPGRSESLQLSVALPEDLPPGEYHGALALHGFRAEGVPVTITVTEETPGRTERSAASEEPEAP